MTQRRPLILDLDFTLLHLAQVPDAVEVPGRTRSAYLGGATIAALGELQSRFEIVLATARSWDGARWVADGLAARGVEVGGIVLEDGALLGTPSGFYPLDPQRDWDELRGRVDSANAGWPAFEWQTDFKACLVARAASPDSARELQPMLNDIAQAQEPPLRTFRDGRKVYIAGQHADKWTALQTLLGERVKSAAGVGDGLNDLCWMPGVAVPCTLTGAAPQVVEWVTAAGGIVSPQAGHEGIVDVLRRIGEWDAIQTRQDTRAAYPAS